MRGSRSPAGTSASRHGARREGPLAPGDQANRPNTKKSANVPLRCLVRSRGPTRHTSLARLAGPPCSRCPNEMPPRVTERKGAHPRRRKRQEPRAPVGRETTGEHWHALSKFYHFGILGILWAWAGCHGSRALASRLAAGAFLANLWSFEAGQCALAVIDCRVPCRIRRPRWRAAGSMGSNSHEITDCKRYSP